MFSIRLNNNWLRPFRFIAIAFACGLLLFSSAYPAMAAGRSTPTNPTEGETQLNKILDKSEEAAKSGLSSMRDVEKRSERGLNEVQADADYSKMQRPENSQNATSVIDQIKESFDKVTPNN